MKKNKKITVKDDSEVARYKRDPHVGLSSEEVASRISDGLINTTKKRVSKSYFRIFFDNFVNVFNIILYVMAALLIIVEKYSSLFFLIILVFNITINLIQDIRARRMTDKLKLSTEPRVKVVRDSKVDTILTSELVLDDVFIVSSGNLISCDGTVLSGNCAVDESSLSGESVLVKKDEGDTVLSGTYVRYGTIRVRAEKVGAKNYVERMQEKTREFKRPKTEIFKSINNILKVIAGIVLFMIALTLLLEGLDGNLSSFASFKTIVGPLAGSIVPMIPSGMYLLTSVTLTYGVIRLHKHHALVQEIYSIETLARTDTLCLDKTGTLTDGNVIVEKVEYYQKYTEFDVKRALLTLLHATQDQNPSALSLLAYYDRSRNFRNFMTIDSFLAFDSANKYSLFVNNIGETYILGAPEALLDKESKAYQEAIKKAGEGHRVMVFGRLKKNKGKVSETNFQLMAMFELGDHIRKDAKQTLEWFYANNVNSIIISGDNLEYIQSIARKVGFHGHEKGISLEGMSLEEVKKIALKFQIFARATPEHKEVIVKTLQENKHVVTMIGDGVNDILALKSANCSVAMASGSDAAKSISHLVLTQSNFSALPEVVKEGRRVVNNLQRTCSLFLVKTFFSIVMSLTFLIARPISMLIENMNSINYPLDTSSFYLWDIFSIGVAAAFLAFEPNYQVIKGTFTKNAILQAIPSAIAMLVAVGGIFLLQSYEVAHPGTVFINETNSVTMAGVVMSVMGVFILLRVCLPFSKWRLSVFAVISTIVTGLVFSLGFVNLKDGTNLGALLLQINYNNLTWINFFEMLSMIAVGALILVGLNYVYGYITKQKVGIKNEN